jgi:hypothetical protein
MAHPPVKKSTPAAPVFGDYAPMALRVRRLAPLFALVFLALVLVPASSAWAAKHKKPAKTWPSKKSTHRTEKKDAPAAADDADEDSGAAAATAAKKGGGDDDDDADDNKPDSKSQSKAKPAAKAAKVKLDENDEGDEKEARKSKDEDEGDDDDSEAPVVRKKASKHAAAEPGEHGAAVALAIEVGSRGVHRTFDFNDPRFYPGTTSPGAYQLKVAPVPFIHLGFYPLAFAGPGGLANVGLVGRYERLIGVSTVDKSGMGLPTSMTSGQEWDVGLRGRLPFDSGELGVSATYGQHTFLLSSGDVPPSATATVPNVEYIFYRVDLDGAVALGPVTVGAHVGTRFVPKTGALGTWFGTTKTTSIETGLSVAYRLTPVFEVVAGGDFLRYAFAFNPPTNNGIVAGGAVDQYISGYLALRVSITGG